MLPVLQRLSDAYGF